MAQSITTFRPSKVATFERRDEMGDVRIGALRRCEATIAAASTGAAARASSRARVRSRPRPRRVACGRRRASSLTPLSDQGLWLAEITAAAASSACARYATPGRREHADRDDARTLGRESAHSAASMREPDSRVSRPTTNDARPRTVRGRASERYDEFVSEIGVRVAPDAVGAEPQHGRRVSALRVLRGLAGLLQAVLAPFLLARVARQEAGLLQRTARCPGRAPPTPARCRAGSRRPGPRRRRRRASRRRRRPLRSA